MSSIIKSYYFRQGKLICTNTYDHYWCFNFQWLLWSMILIKFNCYVFVKLILICYYYFYNIFAFFEHIFLLLCKYVWLSMLLLQLIYNLLIILCLIIMLRKGLWFNFVIMYLYILLSRTISLYYFLIFPSFISFMVNKYFKTLNEKPKNMYIIQ